MWTAVDHFRQGILAWELGDHSAETFQLLWDIVYLWKYYFYVTDGWNPHLAGAIAKCCILKYEFFRITNQSTRY
ncbi:Mobile element protein [Richelia intracellularis]|nr:Mobile element protein [Richelia intracellularis]